MGMAVAVAIVVWLGLTAASQITALQAFTGRLDVLGLLPRWTFFAPRPGVTDYHLVVRQVDPDGPGAWMAVPMVEDRPRLAPLWHPQKRSKKILTDAVQSLRVVANHLKGEDGALQFSVPYLLLLQIAKSRAPAKLQGAMQFAVIEATGHSERQLTGASFVSRVHEC